MRSPRNIAVPERFGVYVVVAGFAVWALHTGTLLLIYGVSVAALVVRLWAKGERYSD
jgi:hypothetical protein